MIDINKVILMGRLGGDPARRQTKSGKSVVHFSLATSRRVPKEDKVSSADRDPFRDAYQDNSRDASRDASTDRSTGTPVEFSFSDETQWHSIVCWGKQGEACAHYLKKGNAIYLEGHLRYRQYEDKKGQTKLSVEVHTETVSFLSSKNRKSEPKAVEDRPSSENFGNYAVPTQLGEQVLPF